MGLPCDDHDSAPQVTAQLGMAACLAEPSNKGCAMCQLAMLGLSDDRSAVQCPHVIVAMLGNMLLCHLSCMLAQTVSASGLGDEQPEHCSVKQTGTSCLLAA